MALSDESQPATAVETIPRSALFPIEPAALASAMGGRGASLPPRLQRRAEQAAAVVERSSRPRLCRRRLSLSRGQGGFLLDGRGPFKSANLDLMLAVCSHVYAFLVTLGPELDSRLQAAQGAGVAEAYVLDAIAAQLTEAAAAYAEERIRQQLAPGEEATMRISPGYCDWPVSQQALLFSLLDGAAVGVSLTEGGMMQPRKSISSILGVGPRERVLPVRNACLFCGQRDCPYRREA